MGAHWSRSAGLNLHMLLNRFSSPLTAGRHFLGGAVRNDLGEAIPGVHVRIKQTSDDETLTWDTSTDKDGAFLVEGLVEGKARVTLVDLDQDLGYQKWPETFQGIEVDRSSLEIRSTFL